MTEIVHRLVGVCKGKWVVGKSLGTCGGWGWRHFTVTRFEFLLDCDEDKKVPCSPHRLVVKYGIFGISPIPIIFNEAAVSAGYLF